MWGVAVILALLGVVGIFAYFSIKLNEAHFGIRILLFAGSFLMLIVGVATATAIADGEGGSGDVLSLLDVSYFFLIIVFIFVFFILTVMFIRFLLDLAGGGRGLDYRTP